MIPPLYIRLPIVLLFGLMLAISLTKGKKKTDNRQKSGKCLPPSSEANLGKPISYSYTRNKHNSRASHQKPMERKNPLPIKQLEEEYKNGTTRKRTRTILNKRGD